LVTETCIYKYIIFRWASPLIGKNELKIRKRFVEMENFAKKFGLQLNQEKTKYMITERKSSLKNNKIGHLNIKKLQI